MVAQPSNNAALELGRLELPYTSNGVAGITSHGTPSLDKVPDVQRINNEPSKVVNVMSFSIES